MHTDSGPGPGPAPRPGGGAEDTLDLRLPDDFLRLFRGNDGAGPPTQAGVPTPASTVAPAPAPASTVTPPPAWESAPPAGQTAATAPGSGPGRAMAAPLAPAAGDLLDNLGGWEPAATPVGVFRLVPVIVQRDLALISVWMNDPAVAAFWELAGPDSVTATHLRAQLDGDGRSIPCLGVLDDKPMSYFEIYRADLDPLARHYPARPHDTGIHLLIGGVVDRGRGIGSVLLRAVSDLVLDNRPRCTRVLAEPDMRNTPSVSAFLTSGFRYSAELDLPDKRAALMVRDRALRNLL
ncbi:GNAT family N-acetyltransferase [Streptomyces sp. Tu 2975]|uniref:GNAT family N-acetyltransferase n=1 Tax=Streptomyces sp. Tu 2975 TaxID=2676871 RepID=UPI00135B1CE1|nr:GNAT family N-acetyltransferase [Streptomyces sp. Tu 2975]QIP88456.1 GNAT family N-acetyltransferase [Streptomyces sp. Tu 2975]